MRNNYELYIDYEENTLEIVKVPSKQPVKHIEVKYGIIISQDINGHTVQISIPDFDVLFGVKRKDIETFLMYSP